MIINHTYKFIFLHIPKTAGTAVVHELSRLTTYKDLEIGGTPFGQKIAPYFRDKFKLRKHGTYEELRKIMGDEIEDYTLLTFVRNPIERTVSIFKFLKQWKAWKGSEVMNQFTSFDDFVTSDFFKTAGPDNMFRPQTFWLQYQEETIVPDIVGYTHSIKSDLSHMLTQVSGDQMEAFPKVRNKSAAKSPNISQKTINLLENKYQLDFQKFEFRNV